MSESTTSDDKRKQRIQELTQMVLARLNGIGIDLANKEACESDLSQTVCSGLCLWVYREYICPSAEQQRRL